MNTGPWRELGVAFRSMGESLRELSAAFSDIYEPMRRVVAARNRAAHVPQEDE